MPERFDIEYLRETISYYDNIWIDDKKLPSVYVSRAGDNKLL